jgi:hypothetical protein
MVRYRETADTAGHRTQREVTILLSAVCCWCLFFICAENKNGTPAAEAHSMEKQKTENQISSILFLYLYLPRLNNLADSVSNKPPSLYQGANFSHNFTSGNIPYLRSLIYRNIPKS